MRLLPVATCCARHAQPVVSLAAGGEEVKRPADGFVSRKRLEEWRVWMATLVARSRPAVRFNMMSTDE